MSPPPASSERRICQRCGKSFYAGGVWGLGGSKRFCSTFCSARPLEEVDHALERAIEFLLRQRGPGRLVALADIVAHVGLDPTCELRRAVDAVQRLERAGVIERVEHGGELNVRSTRTADEHVKPSSGIRARVRQSTAYNDTGSG